MLHASGIVLLDCFKIIFKSPILISPFLFSSHSFDHDTNFEYCVESWTRWKPSSLRFGSSSSSGGDSDRWVLPFARSNMQHPIKCCPVHFLWIAIRFPRRFLIFQRTTTCPLTEENLGCLNIPPMRLFSSFFSSALWKESLRSQKMDTKKFSTGKRQDCWPYHNHQHPN